MTLSVHLDAGGLAQGLHEAGGEISRLAEEEIAPAARLIEEAFTDAGRAIERELTNAARTGELSLKRLGQSIANDIGRTAIDGLVRQPVENFLTDLLAAPFGGARAAGGPVGRGKSYLVGERGPEVFTPASAGAVAPARAGGVNVSISLPGVTNAESFRASETQIAASLARVLARAERNR